MTIITGNSLTHIHKLGFKPLAISAFLPVEQEIVDIIVQNCRHQTANLLYMIFNLN